MITESQLRESYRQHTGHDMPETELSSFCRLLQRFNIADIESYADGKAKIVELAGNFAGHRIAVLDKKPSIQ